MKFLKENLTLVIIAIVVLLSIGSIFYPTGTWRDDLANDMGEHFSTIKTEADKKANTQLDIPSVVDSKGVPTTMQVKGWPTPNLLKNKDDANKAIKTEAIAVVKLGADANKANRLDRNNVPLIGNLAQLPAPNFLPKMSPRAEPLAFKQLYKTVFDIWTGELVGSSATGLPPRPEELTEAFAQIKAQQNAALPAGLQQANVQIDPKEQADYMKKSVLGRAASIHMYVEPDAFQARPWREGGTPPNEQQMFEALVDSWLQGDAVKAMVAVNAGSANVGSSPIKRLIKITVGSDALTLRLSLNSTQTGGGSPMGMGAAGAPAAGGASNGNGTLFLLPPPPVNAQPAGGSIDSPAPLAVQGANVIDFGKTMTGRSSGTDYDVVPMQIWMDIDPAYINKFEEELYKTNMGYTVLNERSKVVNPLDRASNGYIYGPSQCWEVEITVEALLFRNWTMAIMPDDIKKELGIVTPAPGAPGA